MRLRANTTQTAITVIVDRSRVLENVLDIYRGEPDLTLILRVRFEGEREHDLGELTKDLVFCFLDGSFTYILQ